MLHRLAEFSSVHLVFDLRLSSMVCDLAADVRGALGERDVLLLLLPPAQRECGEALGLVEIGLRAAEQLLLEREREREGGEVGEGKEGWS